MLHQEFKPPEALCDTIKCFWYNSIDLGERESAFEVVPDGYAEIIFYFGSTCSIGLNGSIRPLPSPFIIGLLNQPINFYTKNRLEIIGIRCHPWTVFDMLGLPSGKDGVRIFKHPIAKLQPILETYINAGKTEEAMGQLKKYFMDAQLPVVKNNNMLLKAGAAMKQANGNIPVSQVAAAAHATIRTLERNFKKSSGYSVKDVSGLMRFEQVRNQLWIEPNVNLAGLAHELGYTDQSHLSREFKRYSGTSPAAFAKKVSKQKEATANTIVALVPS